MRRKHTNKVNPCANVLAKIMRVCFLINEETDFDAHFDWAGHVNQLTVCVNPKGEDGHEHAVLEFHEYVNIPSNPNLWGSEFRTDTYPKVKQFLAKLQAFYEQRLAD